MTYLRRFEHHLKAFGDIEGIVNCLKHNNDAPLWCIIHEAKALLRQCDEVFDNVNQVKKEKDQPFPPPKQTGTCKRFRLGCICNAPTYNGEKECYWCFRYVLKV